jgi:hypothetical protein
MFNKEKQSKSIGLGISLGAAIGALVKRQGEFRE